MQAADWQHPDKHQTTLINRTANRVELRRVLDNDSYSVSLALEDGATVTEAGAHSFVLKAAGKTGSDFRSPHSFGETKDLAHFQARFATLSASTKHWRRFWSTGGAVELTDSKDKRAPELERRIVLSQYLH